MCSTIQEVLVEMATQPVLAIKVGGVAFHKAGNKQAEQDIKKNSILKKCAIPLLRLRTDSSGEKENYQERNQGQKMWGHHRKQDRP